MRASKAEIKIETILKENGVVFEEEYVFPELKSTSGRVLRFDFAIFGDDGCIDALIEYNGKQHYEPCAKYGGRRGLYEQQFNDKKKVNFCRTHGIKLVVIPYWQENLISYDKLMEWIYG